ncbi:MAG: [FeFe] hydrogenase H-cluster radical SAM maturase HydE [Clostridiales bacterium]|nr:[FeFe] hydrogenase H-cluster radical SAM maturase HydE [Clostridiales bacterium]
MDKNIDILKEKLYRENNLGHDELKALIDTNMKSLDEEIFNLARQTKEQYYGKAVYFRGLMEFSNYCRNNCYYCGIRKGNLNIRRYRLTAKDILDSCKIGHRLGFRTFVLQSGDDPYFTDDKIVEIVDMIKNRYPDAAVTLSIGERDYASYRRFWEAGTDRYLLRHETANKAHYNRLHPESMSFQRRKKCLYKLKDIGFQVGAGFMVGSPYQTVDNMVEDLLFLKELEPHMVGIGPFIPHKDTVFKDKEGGDVNITLLMLALVRLLLPKVLLPSTTALGTIDPLGREKGLMAGANVVMPNLSPKNFRADYSLYDNKIATGLEAAEGIDDLRERIESMGLKADMSRGDHVDM